MADNPTGDGAQPEVPPNGTDEWAPGLVPQNLAAEAPPEPVAPKAVQQPGGPDMIQVPRIDPETGEVQQPSAPVAPPVAPPAAPVVAPAPVAAAPFTPPAPTADYTQYAPPAYAAPTPPKRRRIPWWVWVIIGGVLLLGAAFIAVLVLVLQHVNQGHSPSYTGAPIAPTEQGATPSPTATGDASPPQQGANEVVSDSGAVAYVISEGWVDAHDYLDLSVMEEPLEEGQDIVGAYFTGDPGSVTPQFVVVLESSPSLANRGTYDDQMDQYLTGFATSAQSVTEATRVPITTANGLEGLQGDFTATYNDADAPVRVTILGNGNRLVFVQWISYSGPIDDAGYQAFVDSVRIDP